MGCFVESGSEMFTRPTFYPSRKVTNIPFQSTEDDFLVPVWWNMLGCVAVSFCINFQIEIKANFNYRFRKFQEAGNAGRSIENEHVVKFTQPTQTIWITLSFLRYGGFLKWWYPPNTQKWSFLEGKTMVVGYHHFRKPPYIGIYMFIWPLGCLTCWMVGRFLELFGLCGMVILSLSEQWKKGLRLFRVYRVWWPTQFYS